ncbi:uncharacterized protein LOC103574512 [Microplitis demolitor]|uniref:uncharacterized protein LOC103574512 n=1 Tax=Microplitis demolitor TaxID=69319 RepID=UPI0004CDC7C0|nr:uncharacterized protein LOC103574512 [Microplitis demolitor]
MTAAKFNSAKSEAESPLLRNRKYGTQIFGYINSIKIFRNRPSLNSWIISFIHLMIILVLLILLTPPLLVLIPILSTIFMFTIVATKGTLLSMTNELSDYYMHACVLEEDNRGRRTGRVDIFLTKKSRIMWIWCLIIAYTLPELINSFVCSRRAKNKPSARQFLSVIIPETFHTIGIALMIFEILPQISSAQETLPEQDFSRFLLFIIWCVIEWGLHNLISTIFEIKDVKLKSLLIVTDIVILGIFLCFTMFNPFDGINLNDSDCWIVILAMAFTHGGLWQDVSNSTFSFTSNLSPIVKAREKLKPVKDSIFAWVSLWKIIVFIASSFTILARQRYSITELFTMAGPAFRDYNITLKPSSRDMDSITIVTGLRLPILIVSFQVILSVIVNMKPNSIILRFFHGFDFRSRWGLNIPVFFTIAYLLWSEFIRSLQCNLLYNQDMFEHFMYFLQDFRTSKEFIKIFSLDPCENRDTLLLKISICWIVLHFLFRSRINAVLKTEKELEKPKTKTPQEVTVVSKDETVEEEKKFEC